MKITNVMTPGFEKLEADAEKSVKVQKAKDAAGQFEAVFVRQLLQESKMFGKGNNAMSGMAVDAMADSIEKGGGLGLTQLIERSLLESKK